MAFATGFKEQEDESNACDGFAGCAGGAPGALRLSLLQVVELRLVLQFLCTRGHRRAAV
jgi:hypothetical protein